MEVKIFSLVMRNWFYLKCACAENGRNMGFYPADYYL